MRGSFSSGTRCTAIILTLYGLLLISGNAFGAGGTCPTAANYLNTATNALVTLSSLGVTSCYFIAANGSDTNNGTSEATPWLHAPGMSTCSGTCASTTPAAGEGFIFRGGDTWHFGNSSASPYTGGEWVFQYNHATSSSPIYIGVDPTWYSGSSWARPILTWDNPLTPNPGTFDDYVSSCTYPAPDNGQAVTMNMAGQEYTIFDNFEVTGVCQSATQSSTTALVEDSFGQYNSFLNLYVHGWTHAQYVCSSASGATCNNIRVFAGTGYATIEYLVIDGSDSDPGGMEVAKSGMTYVAYSVIRYVSQLIVTLPVTWHDTLIEHFACPGDQHDHANFFEQGEGPGTVALYNNVFRHLMTDSGYCPGNSAVGMWLEGAPSGYSLYMFDNVVYDVSNALEYINVGAGNANMGTDVIFNNTFQSNGPTIYDCQSTSYAYSLTLANNHYITSGPANQSCGSNDTVSPVTELWQTPAVADADSSPSFNQYTGSETYGYSPVASTNSTVGAGTNEGTINLAFCSALTTAASSQPVFSDAATACQSDTRYACTYNSTSHTVSCPARTVVTRPSSAAWDIGAYEFSDPNPPAPPTDVQATAH